MLSSLGVSLAEYARYSPLLYFPFYVLPDRPLQLTLEPWSSGAGDPRCLLRRRVPVDQEYLGGSQAGGLTFSIVLLFVLAFLRHPCILVFVLRYYCFR